MLTVKIGTQSDRFEAIVDPTATTPIGLLEEKNVVMAGATISINAITLQHSELNKTFAELGYNAGATIMLQAIVKANNGR